MIRSLEVVGIGASPGGSSSRSAALLDGALELLARRGIRPQRVDLATLPAEGLLGRARTREVEAALAAVLRSDLLVVATPIYRATYSGLLKVFFDLLPNAALAGKVAIPIASGGSPGHQLAIDHGLRPLLASVGAVVVATGIYGTPDQFAGSAPDRTLLERLEHAVEEALDLAGPRRAAHPDLVDNRKAG